MAKIRVKKNISEAFQKALPTDEKRIRPWHIKPEVSKPPPVDNFSKPTVTPTDKPTVTPTDKPTVTPTDKPTVTPTEPTVTPTEPTVTPTVTPTPTVGVKKLYTSDLPRQQEEIILYLLSIKDSQDPNKTRPVGYNRIAKQIQSERIFVKRSIENLSKLGFITGKESFNGMIKGTIYSLGNIEIVKAKTPTATVTPTVTPTRSSSSFFTTTTEELPNLDQFASLKKIGFTDNHSKQILEGGLLSLNDLEKSLEFIDWSIEHEKLKANMPLNYIMGILRKGTFNRPDGYKSKIEIWRENEAKAEKEEAERLKKLEEQIFENKYTIWRSKLTPEEIHEISPMFKKGEALDAMLRANFRDNIFSSGE